MQKFWKVIFNIMDDYGKTFTEVVVISEEPEQVLARTERDLYESYNTHWIVFIREITEQEYNDSKVINGKENGRMKLQQKDLLK